MAMTTIGRLFEVLQGPPIHTDSEIAGILGLNLLALRVRLVDLRRRGILAGPFEDGEKATWRSWFPTLAATTEASERSGLRAESPALLGKSWWDGMWANE